MIKKLLQAAVLVAGGLALGGCPLQQDKTTAPANKPAAADCQAALTTPAPADASIRSGWSRVGAGSTTDVSPGAQRPARSIAALTCALATGSA